MVTSYQAPIPPVAPHAAVRVGGYDAHGVPQDTLGAPGAPAQARATDRRVQRPAPACCGRRRSVTVSVLLAALLGPFGLLYSSKAGALATSVLFFLVALPLVALWWKWVFVAAALTAPMCVAWAFVATIGHNARLALRHRWDLPTTAPLA